MRTTSFVRHQNGSFRSVLPNGLAISGANPCPGSVADITIFCENASLHARELKKSAKDQELVDGDQEEAFWADNVTKALIGISD
ncbi:TPA: hypothetical protein N0F65_000671 [Lagenidium giganteum]|uniref:Uncharacterized protein n=1 Tax=Lagenidium giganteum TaxID=4803 RepID=A0AAV2YQQ4_9STRA|nr:TPA: hypothetical protein N0F65_000671 [Lagenidium giganteum]